MSKAKKNIKTKEEKPLLYNMDFEEIIQKALNTPLPKKAT
jgi:hypothetical protein